MIFIHARTNWPLYPCLTLYYKLMRILACTLLASSVKTEIVPLCSLNSIWEYSGLYHARRCSIWYPEEGVARKEYIYPICVFWYRLFVAWVYLLGQFDILSFVTVKGLAIWTQGRDWKHTYQTSSGSSVSSHKAGPSSKDWPS